MRELHREPRVILLRQGLRERYRRAINYAVAYRSGWEEAWGAYARLRAFEGALARWEEAALVHHRPAA